MPRPYLWNPTDEIERIRENLNSAFVGCSSDLGEVVKETIDNLSTFKEYLAEMLGEM